MQAFFRLNNSILDCGLTPNELKVAVCLYSCVFNNRCVVQIKQATIAQKCGIKKIETVANIICQLQRKGIGLMLANIKLIDNGAKLFVDFPKSQRRESGVVSPDVIPLTKRVRGYIEREIIREYFKRKRGTKIQ